MVFFFVDLEFGVGPLVLFLSLNAAGVAAIAVWRRLFKPRPPAHRELLYITPLPEPRMAGGGLTVELNSLWVKTGTVPLSKDTELKPGTSCSP